MHRMTQTISANHLKTHTQTNTYTHTQSDACVYVCVLDRTIHSLGEPVRASLKVTMTNSVLTMCSPDPYW